MHITSRMTFRLLLIVGLLFNLIFLYRLRSNIFWDLDVYQNAINIFNSGGNPYYVPDTCLEGTSICLKNESISQKLP